MKGLDIISMYLDYKDLNMRSSSSGNINPLKTNIKWYFI